MLPNGMDCASLLLQCVTQKLGILYSFIAALRLATTSDVTHIDGNTWTGVEIGSSRIRK